MMFNHKNYTYDLIVLGSGPGGDVAANYAAVLGKKVLVIEKDVIGGECPNYGCIPTKAILHSAATYTAAKNAKEYGVFATSLSLKYPQIKKWKDLAVSRTGAAEGEKVFDRNGIDFVKGEAFFVSPHEIQVGEKIYSSTYFLIATGADTFIPPIEGLEETSYITYKEAVNLLKAPKSLFILGGGVIGCEFAQFFSSVGSKVTIADSFEKLLFKEDNDVSNLIQALFENRGIQVLLDTHITQVEKKGKKKIVHYQIGEETKTVEVEEILLATGTRPHLEITPGRAGIKLDDGQLAVNEYLQTNVPHIFAAGDVIGPFQFTHTASYQSYLAGQNMFAKKKVKEDLTLVPRCIFTKPEIASVGLTEQAARDKGIHIKIGAAAIAELGRANTANEFDGFVKVITDHQGVIIGASIISPHAGDMIHELALAIKLKAKASDIATMIHAFPTFSEAIKYACANVG